LINSWLYYNNLGDNFEFGSHLGNNSNEFLKIINNEKKNINMNSHVGLFNIIVLGRPGTGKSTLINILSNQKRSLEGRGESVTKKMIKYIIKDYNISLYDTPGFELDKDINEIIQFINNVQKHLIQRKNQINMAFYLITEGARDFYDNEKKILMEYNIPIFFLLTFSRNLEKGQEFKEIVEINLRRTLKLLDKNKGMAYYNSKIKVFPVHLLDENDGSCNNFGIKTVMEAAFDKFKHCIIEENELGYFNDIRDDYQKEISDDRPNRIREIFNLLEGKEIYKYFKDIDDILSCSISESESVISYYLKVFFALNILFPSFLLMKSIKTNLLKAILDKFKKVIDNKEKEELIQNNLKEIKDYNLFKSHCPFYNLFYNYKNIRDFGNKYIKIFTEELKNAGIDGLSKFIKEFLLDYNNAINGLKEIGKNFNE
jgi:GTP-binding protein EngB required for normal cell division